MKNNKKVKLYENNRYDYLDQNIDISDINDSNYNNFTSDEIAYLLGKNYYDNFYKNHKNKNIVTIYDDDFNILALIFSESIDDCKKYNNGAPQYFNYIKYESLKKYLKNYTPETILLFYTDIYNKNNYYPTRQFIHKNNSKNIDSYITIYINDESDILTSQRVSYITEVSDWTFLKDVIKEIESMISIMEK